MVNEELVDLCRTVVAAIQESESFTANQLRKLLLHVVPQLLTELEILDGVLESLLQDRKPEPPAEEPKAKRKKDRKRKRKDKRK